MRRLSRKAPMDYRLCRQTVTLYHRNLQPGGPQFTQIRFQGAYMDLSINRRTGQTGQETEGCFLLVLPSGWQGRLNWLPPAEYDRMSSARREGCFTLSPGDKVVLGEGPPVADPQQFSQLGVHENAVVVKELAVRSLGSTLCHIEASGPQLLGRSGLPHPRKGMMR